MSCALQQVAAKINNMVSKQGYGLGTRFFIAVLYLIVIMLFSVVLSNTSISDNADKTFKLSQIRAKVHDKVVGAFGQRCPI